MLKTALKVSVLLVLAFFIGQTATGCAGIRLPDRSKCTVPYGERKECLADVDCDREELCAFRGNPVGRCTLEDCCEPWRNRRMETGGDWCEKIKPNEGKDYSPVKDPDQSK